MSYYDMSVEEFERLHDLAEEYFSFPKSEKPLIEPDNRSQVKLRLSIHEDLHNIVDNQ